MTSHNGHHTHKPNRQTIYVAVALVLGEIVNLPLVDTGAPLPDPIFNRLVQLFGSVVLSVFRPTGSLFLLRKNCQ